MEGVLVIFLLVIFFLLLSVKKGITNKIQILQDKIDGLSAEIKKGRVVAPVETRKPLSEDDAVQSAFSKPSPVPIKQPDKKIS